MLNKMRIKGTKLFIFLCLANVLLWGRAKILHSPPRNAVAGIPVKIEALVEGDTVEVEQMRIFYREAGQSSFIEEEISEYMGVYTGYIPAEHVTERGIEYLVIADLVGGSAIAFPEVDPYNVPMFISVKKGAETKPSIAQGEKDVTGGIQSGILVLSPEEGEVVAAADVVLAFSLFNAPNVSLESVRLEVDGVSVVKQAEISQELIIARPQKLRPGLHTVKLNLKNQSNDPYAPIVINFTVVQTREEAQRVLQYNGRVATEASSEQVRGVRQDIQWLRANISGSYDWLSFDAKTFITSQEEPDKQPRNRLTAGLKSSYLDLTFGDVNPIFTEFGLRGKRVRGFEANVKLKLINAHIVYGQTERAIQGDIIADTSAIGQYTRNDYTYGRNLFAIRPYFGSGKNFQFGLSLIKARDDTLSVKRGMGGIKPGNGVSVLMGGANKPQDNFVIGTDLLLALDSKRFVWKSNAAISYLNRDISGGPLTLEQLDTFMPGDSLKNDTLSYMGMDIPLSMIPMDPKDFAEFFIINKNISPWLPIVPDSSGNIGLREFLNMPSTAFKTSLKLNYFNNFFVAEYQRVGPEFNSLGNPYLRNDVQGYNLSDKIRLFRDKMFVNLTFDQKRDNLNEDKNATTTTTSLNAGISLYPGEGLPNLNFNTMQYIRQNDLGLEDVKTDTLFDKVVTDSIIGYKYTDLREDNVTIRQDFRISHNIQFGNIKHNLNVNYANSDRSDRVKLRKPGYQFIGTATSLLAFGINSTFLSLPLKTNLKYSNNKTTSTAISDPYILQTVLVKGRYEFFNGSLAVELSYTLNNGSGAIDFSKHTVATGGMYTLKKIHQFRWSFGYTFLDDRLTDEVFNDISFMAGYSLIF